MIARTNLGIIVIVHRETTLEELMELTHATISQLLDTWNSTHFH